jgi:hypothetical protein
MEEHFAGDFFFAGATVFKHSTDNMQEHFVRWRLTLIILPSIKKL